MNIAWKNWMVYEEELDAMSGRFDYKVFFHAKLLCYKNVRGVVR